MQEATREIFWTIPSWYVPFMYFSLAVATFFFIWGIIPKFKYITNGKSFKELLPEKFNFGNFLRTIFFTGKVTQKGYVGVFHALIYYGFFILFIATELVALHTDTPFRVFKGTTYIVISFLADFAGLAVLLGIIMAYKRRYIDKPATLSATRPKQEIHMYGMLVLLVLVGYMLEGIRIAVLMPIAEQVWSPVGWIVGMGIRVFGLEQETLQHIYSGLWMFHMLNTMAFIATIPYTKFFHMVMAPLSAILTPPRRGGVLKRMDFEDETKETFGLGTAAEMTMKHRFDTLACVECGRCTEVCPAQLAGKPLNPKTIITKARDLIKEGETEGKSLEEIDFWEKNTYSAVELDSCTSCGACMEVCPMNIEHVDLIFDLKRYKTLTRGEIPQDAANAVNNIKINGNPWGLSQEDRFKWAEGLDVPLIEEGKKVEYLYYIGCAGAYDSANQKTAKDTVRLLKKAGVDFAVIGKYETCNGDPIRRFGDEYSFEEVALQNIENINRFSFDKIITHCPHGLHTIGKEYKAFPNGSFKVVHHTELLAELIREEKLKPTKEVNTELTYHDPCYLGRHHGEYDAPRDILTSIPGVKLKEMKKNRKDALCCGMGGGNMWYEISQGTDLVVNRLAHVDEVHVTKLATACSYCMINFISGRGKLEGTENLEVEDIASILNKSIE